MKTKGFFVWIAAALLLAGMFSACKEVEGLLDLAKEEEQGSGENGGNEGSGKPSEPGGEEPSEPGGGGDEDNREKAAAPTPSPAAGAVSYGAEITLSTTTDGASIYYTIDGNEPSTDSTLYAAPISITGATTIKAIAVKEGFTNSAVLNAEYTVSLDGFLTWLGTGNNAASNNGSHTYTLTADESISPSALSYGNSTVSITLTGAGTERTVSLSSKDRKSVV